jgi:hypothetical protein
MDFVVVFSWHFYYHQYENINPSNISFKTCKNNIILKILTQKQMFIYPNPQIIFNGKIISKKGYKLLQKQSNQTVVIQILIWL